MPRVPRARALSKVFGGYVGGVIPDPIPNSEVKPSRADGTARVTAWESRTPPELILKPRMRLHAGLFLFRRPRARRDYRQPVWRFLVTIAPGAVRRAGGHR